MTTTATASLPRQQADEDTLRYAARALGVAAESTCHHCAGKGRVKRPVKPSDFASFTARYKRPRSWQVVDLFANPTLQELRTIADKLGVDLETAAGWCEKVATTLEHDLTVNAEPGNDDH